MGNVCRNLTNEEKEFFNEESIKNRIKFFVEFLEYEDNLVKYVITGLGDDDLILNREQLINLIHNGKVKFEIVTYDTCIAVLNNIPITIEYL